MKIFIVSRGYPSDKYKTNGIFEFDQAKALAEAGCEVVLLAVDVRSLRRWRKWGYAQKRSDNVSVLIYNLPLGRIPNIIKYALSRSVLDKLYKKAVMLFGMPDIIHAHFFHMGYIASKTKYLRQVPLVITEHSSKIHNATRRSNIKKIASVGYQKASYIISVSSSVSNHLHSIFNIQSIVIPNIVDLSLFMPNKSIQHDFFQFVCTASLTANKALDILIQAFAVAFHKNNNIRLSIIGEGNMRKKLERLINKLNLEDKITLLGSTNRPEISRVFASSDCFILVSMSETFGVSYIEALATGLPVISSRCGGPEDFVNGENGLLVDKANIIQTADAMTYMIDNIEKYDENKISQQIKEMYSGNIVASQLIDLYKEILTC